jgi:triosephosphate isomerase
MGNWKMNKDFSSATGFIGEFFKLAPDVGGRIDVVVFPPFPLIRTVVEAVKEGARWSDLVEVGAQDLYPAERGAYTGAVSGLCLKSVGATRVLVGHSERRNVFGDDDAVVNTKLKAALAYNLNPVLCIGEPLDVREAGDEDKFVRGQLDKAFLDISLDGMGKVTLAYEPLWAIGTGRNATDAEVAPMMVAIREWAEQVGIPGGGESLCVLYGGSVTPENTAELYGLDGVDGFLVGGASIEAFSFVSILEIMAKDQ